MKIDELFDKGVFTMTIEDLIKDIDFMLSQNLPEDKTIEDFTGGYVQQLKNSTKFVAYFGTKSGSNNKATSSIPIPDDEIDLMYMMLKAKIHQMKNSTAKVKKYSIAGNRLAREKEVNSSSSPQVEADSVAVASTVGDSKEEFEWGK